MDFLLKENKSKKTLFAAFIVFFPIVPFYILMKNIGAYLAMYAVGRTADSKYYGGEGYPVSEQIKDTFITRSEIFSPLIIASICYSLLRKSAKDNKIIHLSNIKEWILLAISLVWGVKAGDIGLVYFPWLAGLTESFALKEVCLVKKWELPVEIVTVPLIIAGFLICLKILFLIPKEKRVSLIIGAGMGSVAGNIIWHRLIGPVILP